MPTPGSLHLLFSGVSSHALVLTSFRSLFKSHLLLMPSQTMVSKIAPPSLPHPPTPITFCLPSWHLFFLEALIMILIYIKYLYACFFYPHPPSNMLKIISPPKLHKATAMIQLVHFASFFSAYKNTCLAVGANSISDLLMVDVNHDGILPERDRRSERQSK